MSEHKCETKKGGNNEIIMHSIMQVYTFTTCR